MSKRLDTSLMRFKRLENAFTMSKAEYHAKTLAVPC